MDLKNLKEKTVKDLRYEYVESLQKKNYELERELKVVTDDRDEHKEAEMILLAGLVKIQNMFDINIMKKEASNSIKQAKEVLLKSIKK